MKLRLVILSVICFACLITPTFSMNLRVAKVVASQAAQEITEIGIKTLAAKKAAVAQAASDIAAIAASGVVLKGKALKTAASSIAGAMINKALSIGATVAKAGIDVVAASLGAEPSLVPAAIVFKPPVLQESVEEIVEYEPVITVPVQMPPINTVSVDIGSPHFPLPPPPELPAIWTLDDALPAIEVVGPANSPFTYEIVKSPHKWRRGPLIETFREDKK